MRGRGDEAIRSMNHHTPDCGLQTSGLMVGQAGGSTLASGQWRLDMRD